MTNDLSDYLGAPVVVENIGGGSGSIGAQRMLRTRPDGLTMMYGSSNETILAPLINESVSYDTSDFNMVALGGWTAFALAGSPRLGVKNIDELIELGKSRPKDQAFTYGSVGIGSVQHLCCESIAAKTGMNMLHVPYPGAAPGLNDLLGGQIDLFPLTVTSAQQHFDSGKLINFGVTLVERDSLAPSLASINEGKYLSDFSFTTWGAYFVSKEVPLDRQRALNDALNKTHALSKIKEQMEYSGSHPPPLMSLEENAHYFQEQTRKLQEIVRSIKLTA
nr:tripartite tricarboxylate transporter substrate binding protein [Pseudomonas sp.]